jgi:hypothetical protein
MSLGMAKGFSYPDFCRVVQRMTVVVIDGRGLVATAELPMEFCNLPIQRLMTQAGVGPIESMAFVVESRERVA